MADDSAKGEKKKRKSKKSKDEKPAEAAEEPAPEPPKKEPAADEDAAEADPPAEEKTEHEPPPPPEHHDEHHKPEKSSALEKIEELLNPSLRIPETVGPYTVPEAVQAGDVNALRELDEKKVIELQEAFALFDADSDGCISEEDLKATFVALGKDPSEEIIQAMLLEAMSPLDFDAFVALMGYKCIELDPEDVLLEAWSKWDANGTGVIPEDKCVDQLHIFPHIREPVIQDNSVPEETVCSENAYNFFPLKTPTENTSIQPPKENSFNIETNQVENSNQDDNLPPAVTRKNFRIRYRKSIFSSDRVLGMRLVYDRIRSENAFTIIGKFQFIDKVMFRNDGSLMPTTYCDYQFLPRPINYAKEQKPESMWRFFHSPRFPAKYPDHIKCTYKFIGRPRNRVEVLFEEIYLLTGHSSCLRHSDKIIVYDSKVADKSSTIDVLCNEVPSRRVISSGPNLLIEFDASSNRTSNGFSAKYRFLDISQIALNGAVEDLTSELVASSTTTEQIRSEVTAMPTIASTTKHLRHADGSQKINNGTDTTTEVNTSKEHIVQQATSSSNSSNSTGVRVCPPDSEILKESVASFSEDNRSQYLKENDGVFFGKDDEDEDSDEDEN